MGQDARACGAFVSPRGITQRRSNYMAKRLWTPAVGLVVVTMLAGACASATPSAAPSVAPATQAPATEAPATEAPATEAPASEAPASEAPAELNLPAVPTGYTELDQALGADKPLAGTKVSIQTQWTGGEGEGFANAIKDFQAATGIAVQVDSIGSSHETVLRTRVEGGQPPDMSQIAQPTAVLAYAKDGKIKDVATFMDSAKLNAE